MAELVCYCFEYSVEDIRRDYLENGGSTIMEKIQMEKKFGNCQCATKNPKGKGCLGDVRQVVEKLKGKPSINVIGGNWIFEGPPYMKDDKQPGSVIILDNSLVPLRKRFNDSRGLIRFIALLSPTCPMGRDKGARAVRENVFEKFPDANISASIVWIPILAEDTFDSALQPITLLNDNRIHHFYDDNRMAGKSIAESVGWAGNVAWDIYLFYEPLAEWREKPPEPKYWMHQLPDEWATKGKYRTGVDLVNELYVSMQKLHEDSSSLGAGLY